MDLYFRVDGQRLTVGGNAHIVADTVNHIGCLFRLSGEWDKFHVFARFIAPDGRIIVREVEDRRIDKDAGLNFGAGVWRMSVHGDEFIDGELVERITSNVVEISVKKSGMEDGDLWDFDIDTGTQIIAKAYEQADRAKAEADRAERNADQAHEDALSVKDVLDDVSDVSAQAARDAETAMRAAESVPNAVRAANDAADRAITAVDHARIATRNAEDAANRAVNVADELTEAKASGAFDGKDWIPTESELNSIADQAAGKLQPSIAELSQNVDNATLDIEAHDGRITALEKRPEPKNVDVQINGESIVQDGVANIPRATTSYAGVVSANPNQGTNINSAGSLVIYSAGNSNIDNRSTIQPITTFNLDYAVKAALTDGKGEEYTDAQKAAARERIGVDDWEVIADITMESDADKLDIRPTCQYRNIATKLIPKTVGATVNSNFCNVIHYYDSESGSKSLHFYLSGNNQEEFIQYAEVNKHFARVTSIAKKANYTLNGYNDVAGNLVPIGAKDGYGFYLIRFDFALKAGDVVKVYGKRYK